MGNIDKLKERIQILETDLRAWIRLGKVWRKSIPSNYALCPTDKGIEYSESLTGPVKEPEEYEIHNIIAEIQGERQSNFVEVCIQEVGPVPECFYKGQLSTNLIAIGNTFKVKRNKTVYITDVIIDLTDKSKPIIMLAEIEGYK